MHDAALMLLSQCESALVKDREHGVVLHQHIGLELRLASLPRDTNQVVKDQAGNAPATELVGGYERQLSAGRLVAPGNEAAAANQDFAVGAFSRHDERRGAVKIHINQLPNVAL